MKSKIKMNPIVAAFIPIVKKNLTPEKAAQVYDTLLNDFPVSKGADGNAIILSKREDIVIATVASVTAAGLIVEVHWQAPLVGLVQRYLESV